MLCEQCVVSAPIGEGAEAMDAPSMRFLCDEMLARLGRYLRAAGYDTVLACDGEPDRIWIDLARTDGRILLTCDRQIMHHKAARGVAVHLPQTRLEHQALHLRERYGVDWMWRPFSRCLVDNSLLLPASASALGRLPPCLHSRHVRECPECARIYWAGSHHRRMRSRLARWNGVAIEMAECG